MINEKEMEKLGKLATLIRYYILTMTTEAGSGHPTSVAVMGASIGMLGTARAQYHLRQSCVFLNMIPANQPEIMVPFAQE